MKNILTAAGLLFGIILSGNTQIVSEKISDVSGNHISADRQGKLYISNDNRLFRYAPDEKKTLEFSGKQNLSFARPDASNPFKIIIFEERFRKFRLLDNHLQALETIQPDLPDGIRNRPLYSRNNKAFYVFDPGRREIFLYSLNFELTENLQLPEIQDNSIILLHSYKEKLYFLNSRNVLFIYDAELALLGIKKLTTNDKTQINPDCFTIVSKQSIMLINPTTAEKKILPPEKNIQAVASVLHQNTIFFTSNDGLRKICLSNRQKN